MRMTEQPSPEALEIVHACLANARTQELLRRAGEKSCYISCLTTHIRRTLERHANVLLLATQVQGERREVTLALLRKLEGDARAELAREFWRVRKRLVEEKRQARELRHTNATLSAAYAKRIEPNWKFDYLPVPPAFVEVSPTGTGLPKDSGVYFVWRSGSIVYIGQSINISARCRSKGHEHVEPGDFVSWVSVSRNELLFAEAFYIGTVRPPANFGRHKREVLAA